VRFFLNSGLTYAALEQTIKVVSSLTNKQSFNDKIMI